MNNPARHVIFGTGAIGLATLEALRRRGETVRMVNRSGSARVSDDVEVIGGNAGDPGFSHRGDPRRRAWSTRPSTRRTPGGPRSSPGSRPGCWPAPRQPEPGSSAWRTSICRTARRTSAHRDPRVRGTHEEGPAPGRDGPGPDGRSSGRTGRGGHRSRVGLLRTARRRPVQPRRPTGAGRPGRLDRQLAGRSRPAAHVHLHSRHRRRAGRTRRTSGGAGSGSRLPTTPTPGPPGNSSTSSIGSRVSPGPGFARSPTARPPRLADQPHPAGTAGDAVPVRGSVHRRQPQDHRGAGAASPARAGAGRDRRLLPSSTAPAPQRRLFARGDRLPTSHPWPSGSRNAPCRWVPQVPHGCAPGRHRPRRRATARTTKASGGSTNTSTRTVVLARARGVSPPVVRRFARGRIGPVDLQTDDAAEFPEAGCPRAARTSPRPLRPTAPRACN